ncbi:MAG: hypothetical protein AB3N18_04565 [Allomuricauda sp.]
MKHRHVDILEYIEFMRECIPNAVEIFTKGNCISFGLILEKQFPGGVVLWDDNHACYKYNNQHYDITGGIDKPKNSRPLIHNDLWSLRILLRNNFKKQ